MPITPPQLATGPAERAAEKTAPEGVLLVVEGIDGVGKTTQVRRLAEALTSAGESVLTSKEPTDGRWGRALKESYDTGRLGFVGELLHFIKDRRQHVEELVGPALAAGQVVILDRYFYSTVAYQGARLADPSPESLARLERVVSRGIPRPHKVFVLDIPAEEGIRRISEGRGDRPNEFEALEALDRSRRIFRWLCRRESERLTAIDGCSSPDRIHRTLLSLTIDEALWPARCGRPHGCDSPRRCPLRERGECQWYELKRTLLPPDGQSDHSAVLALPASRGEAVAPPAGD